VATVLFNAFSFLQEKLKALGRPYANVPVKLVDESTVADLVTAVGLEIADVEAALVNGSVQPFDTVLNDGDRVALVPPGTPGPYRVLLGMVGESKDR
jgi:sulfur carrier protein ThiS